MESEGQLSAGMENKEFYWENHSEREIGKLQYHLALNLTLTLTHAFKLSLPRSVQRLLYSSVFLKRNSCNLS